MPEEKHNNDYDLEPVKYCARCLSLKIKYDEDLDYEWCADCGSTEILETLTEEWEKKYEKRYGHKFVTITDRSEKSKILKMSVGELKELMHNSKNWLGIIRRLYPGFPFGFGKTDSIFLFFDKIIKDRRIDELRQLMINQVK